LAVTIHSVQTTRFHDAEHHLSLLLQSFIIFNVTTAVNFSTSKQCSLLFLTHVSGTSYR